MSAAFERAERETAQAIRKLNIADDSKVALWLEAHLEAGADSDWLASCIADAHKARITLLSKEIVRLRGFIKSIDQDWIENEAADEDEWSDGYEDCLSEYARKARAILAAQVPA